MVFLFLIELYFTHIQFVDRSCSIRCNTASIDKSDREWEKNIPEKGYTIDELRRGNRHDTVTHVILEDEIPSDIHILFPNLTHLRLKEMWLNDDYGR